MPVSRVRVEELAHFQVIVADGKLVIIEGLDIVPCKEL